MKLLIGNPKIGLLIMLITIFSTIPTVALMLYYLNRSKFKELIKWLFNYK